MAIWICSSHRADRIDPWSAEIDAALRQPIASFESFYLWAPRYHACEDIIMRAVAVDEPASLNLRSSSCFQVHRSFAGRAE